MTGDRRITNQHASEALGAPPLGSPCCFLHCGAVPSSPVTASSEGCSFPALCCAVSRQVLGFVNISSNSADRGIQVSICVTRSDVAGSSGPLSGVQIVLARGILVLVLSARASISPDPGQLLRGQLSKVPPLLAFFFTGGKFECHRTLASV